MNFSGSFWANTFAAHANLTSSIDAILERDNFTLEELLSQDEIIQEMKALNTNLSDQ